mmetsp:Transcript_42334/g.101976  ORF Transcript_42334/g.101976 Transcript_42334/m.101976 type:complete len:432 (-) Transcript_42334:412-1707(-)|eukprot:CAMPEP_0113457956 /NCGR_PEP_ID=MMETSP0014_2-20120614/9673_1 /TAXON_ID=2857 /ORGANISM="Nitzschia sp." /LENGTH=431 /DNA_ID=CAMNT_0000349463 /DNA_START=498 /DNA_END=1793 /DNA_ORIENTATION=+ /assembly_acc=CAM_ASM_000159
MTTSDGWMPFATSLVLVWFAGTFDNHLWRMIMLYVQYNVLPSLQASANIQPGPQLMVELFGSYFGDSSTDIITIAGRSISIPTIMWYVLQIVTTVGIWFVPHWANIKMRPKKGCVFITGCDSGMGQATVLGLAKRQSSGDKYEQIFAGCFDSKKAEQSFAEQLTPEQMKFITCVQLDVTSNESVAKAAQTVEKYIKGHPNSQGLTGLVQYHGIAFNGPHYMPIDMYSRQLDVNLVGTIRIIRALLPIMRRRPDPSYRGRIVTTGTGAGPCSPAPPLLTAYMSSKFGLEAYTHALRMELKMIDVQIDAAVINPGFVKPTMLMSEGKKLTAKMWKACEEESGSTIAEDEFGPVMDHFIKHATEMPGTHVSKVVEAAEHALLAPVPRTSYKVGIDSKVGPIVGMMPTGVREWITLHGIYGVLGPAGTLKGYKVG